MARLNPIDSNTATGKAKDLLDGVQAALGVTPNLIRTLAVSPAVLDAYLALSNALSAGTLSAALQEQIALTVAGENHCDYCASAHTLVGSKVGITQDELAANLQGRSSDPHTQAILTLAQNIVVKHGFISDGELAEARLAGLSDAEIAEVTAAVAKNIFTNYFNHIAQTDVDFPLISAGEADARSAAA